MEFTNQEGVSQRLTPSEDPVQLVIDTTPALIHTALPDGSLDFFNRRWLEYVGLPLSEVLGWRWTTAIHPEDVERFVEKWRASVESGEPFEEESRVRRADGVYRWFLHRKVPLRDGLGKVVKWYGSSIEVEGRKRAEEKIRRDERELRQQIDSIPQLVCVFDPNGQILQANQMVLNYTGHTLEEFLKEEAAKKSLHPDDLASYGETRRRGISRGLPFENEARLLERGGEYCWFLFRFNPLRDEAGKILRWYATATNIEDMKKAEERLRRAVQQLQTKQQLLDLAQKAAHVLAFEWYPQEEVNVWSPEHAALYGQPQCSLDVTYQSWKKLVHPKDWPLVLGFIKHAQETGEVSAEFRVVWPDGSIHWLAANGQMFFDDVGQPCRIVGFTGEITPRKLIEEELRRSETYLAEAQRLSQTGSFGWSPTSGELFWSEETFQIFEYDRATKPTVELLLQRVHPEDTVLVKQTIERASQDADDFDFEHRLLMPDGSVKYLRVVAHVVSDESGAIEEGKDPNELKAISCFFGAVMDVTESKQAEEALRQDERELRQLIDFLPQHVMVLDADGHLLEANQMVLDYTGHTLKEMRDEGAEGLVDGYSHPDDAERLWSECQRGLASGAPFEIERRARGKDGRYRWFLFRHRPLLDKEGRIARWFATATDIEDLKQEEEGIRKENIALREEIVKASMFEEIVGTSPALQAVLTLVAKVAPTDSTVLITGETGTGKELIARAIHNRSKRSARAFVSVNCAAIPPSLIASELFGHEKGAFTGAVQRRLGRFELAEGGTIFLDEIGELPAETQIALLRVLQEHEFERVGGNRSIKTDVRVIVATNRNLEAAMTAGTFRRDLFYRLNVFPIEMPPLRERREDIPLLVEYFIDRFARKAGKKIRRINKKTLELLQSYPWPGNIRELQNVIERSVILCEGEDFSVDESWLSRQPVANELGGHMELSQRLAAHEKEAIEAALSESGGRVFGPSGAAAKLGIPRSTLEYKIRSLKIDKYRFKIADPSNDNWP
jgi:PAS domain S-box-containing protein